MNGLFFADCASFPLESLCQKSEINAIIEKKVARRVFIS